MSTIIYDQALWGESRVLTVERNEAMTGGRGLGKWQQRQLLREQHSELTHRVVVPGNLVLHTRQVKNLSLTQKKAGHPRFSTSQQ